MSISEQGAFTSRIRASRGSAGSMTQNKEYTEGVDNSFDAGAMTHYSAYIVLSNIPYLLKWNFGNGLRDMPHLYGLSDRQPLKINQDDIGNFCSGHTNSTGFLDPVIVYSESSGKDTTKFTNGLEFYMKEFVDKYEQYPEDLKRAKIQDHMFPVRNRSTKMNDLLNEFLKVIHEIDPATVEDFKSIINNTAESYMLHVYELRKTSIINPEYYSGCMMNLRLHYFEHLMNGKSIIHLQKEGGRLICNRENAVDPLYNRKMFPALNWEAVIRMREDQQIVKISIWNDSNPSEKNVYYIIPSTKGNRKVPEIHDTPPSYWDTWEKYVTLNSSMNIISGEAESDQKNSIGANTIGSDIKGVDDLRGIQVIYGGRSLGKPYFKSGTKDLGYGQQRNLKPLRAVLTVKGDSDDEFKAKQDAIKAFEIHSNKHSINMDDCSYTIRFILALTYGTMCSCYADGQKGLYGKDNKDAGCTTSWDLKLFRENMSRLFPAAEKKKSSNVSVNMEIKSRKNSKSSNSSIASVETDTLISDVANQEENTVVESTKPLVKPDIDFRNNTEQKEIDVLHNDVCICSIPYEGPYYWNRNILKAHKEKKGDVGFILYAKNLSELNRKIYPS